ncbi:ATPase-like protein 3 [Elsinoe australis]|uniref:ATPase-like protein 3 n=1 Tax=Elsinoe australis TaxID=40998 RepID=A0A4U7B725_9PEZI|nr:ATPase-like protein 3 [Elsinoe australis]
MDTYSDSDRASLATYQTEESSHNHAAPRLSWLRRLCGGTSSNDEDQEASRLVTNATGKWAPNTKKAEEELLVYRDQFWDTERLKWRLEKPKQDHSNEADLQKSIIVVRQLFNDKRMPCRVEVDIKGPKLKNIFRNIFKDAKGINLAGKKITVDPNYFFWAREYLAQAKEHAEKTSDTALLTEVDTALLFIKQKWPSNDVDEMLSQGTISFDYLWAIYPPDTLVVGKHILDDVRVWRVSHHRLVELEDGTIVRMLTSQHADFDGQRTGLATSHLQIEQFPGAMPVEQLPYVPLYLHPERDQIWEKVLARTKKQFTYFKQPFKVQEQQGFGMIQYRDYQDKWVQPQRFKFHGRIMIDAAKMSAVEPDMLIPQLKSFGRKSSSASSRKTPDGRLLEIEDIVKEVEGVEQNGSTGGNVKNARSFAYEQFGWGAVFENPSIMDSFSRGTGDKQIMEHDDLPEEQRILFSGLLYGYGFIDARWGAFSVDNLTDVQWNPAVFRSLVMEPSLKDLMYRLIKSHCNESIQIDDFIRGKGKGLVGLLYGKPGLGKTLTAEAIAETAQTPLLVVSSGNLGHTAEKICDKLAQILDLAAHWRAVLLLDEADVFLYKRGDTDLERNAIVSVFLHELEYYQGILILTTNRAETIDPAFKSRIHFGYQYPELDHKARKQIWNNFLTTATGSGEQKVVVKVDEAGLDRLAELDYNGRQIKNVHSIATKLASSSGDKTLKTEDILAAADTLQNYVPTATL